MKTKLKNWLQEHKKEIGLVTIGGVTGISTVILSKKFYEKIFGTTKITTEVIVNKHNNVGIVFRKINIFGKEKKHGKQISWKPEVTKEVIEDLSNAVKKLEENK